MEGDRERSQVASDIISHFIGQEKDELRQSRNSLSSGQRKSTVSAASGWRALGAVSSDIVYRVTITPDLWISITRSSGSPSPSLCSATSALPVHDCAVMHNRCAQLLCVWPPHADRAERWPAPIGNLLHGKSSAPCECGADLSCPAQCACQCISVLPSPISNEQAFLEM